MIKTLLIGLGNIGMGYDLDNNSEDILTHAKAIKNTPAMRLVGAVESDSKKRHKFEISYKLETYQEVGEAIKKTDPLLVVIAIPTEGHINLINEICKYESLHVSGGVTEVWHCMDSFTEDASSVAWRVHLQLLL